jgi:hypothetical protein
MARDLEISVAFSQLFWDDWRLCLRMEGTILHLLLGFECHIILLHYAFIFLLLMSPFEEPVMHLVTF